ncbi:hypothetical protein BFJ69_g3348 [Fusarium oxysporum]|uniref:Uncharacterized protein n=1 Tax=Fusarium oxysporum TaxID=5507 RepID=A0A420NP64_FUSOX|nr:hypothetical protein BFJ69_g3348 [Fusarium oxysporum]
MEPPSSPTSFLESLSRPSAPFPLPPLLYLPLLIPHFYSTPPSSKLRYSNVV